MKLVIPTIGHKQAAWDYRQEHIDRGETHIHGSNGFMNAESYESWLEKVIWSQTNSTSDWVTGDVYFAIVSGKIVGTIAVRHSLNDALLYSGGHIGYGIRPSERRKGYGSEMLAHALDRCRELSMEKALVTCDKGNIASAKTAQKKGGILENEVVEEDGNIVERYWIPLR
ncbi:GNAT family N-acetyltransferase [Ruminococcaceae bacterium OttesenSCG-928-L11]|nr:GNAT family N-acetyltransferase [Ruminococcaceae bacterium OttesenSCG-928-L11]